MSTTDRLKRTHPPTRLRALRSPSRSPSRAPTHLIVIGTSAGGRTAVKEVIKGLSEDLPAAVVIIRHMMPPAASVGGGMPVDGWLRDVTHNPIHLVANGDLLESGVIYLTPRE